MAFRQFSRRSLSIRSTLLATAAFLILQPIASNAAPSGDAQIGDDVQTVFVEASRAGVAGTGLSATGANDYGMTAEDIAASPAGRNAAVTDVLTRLPGVALDENQQIHIRNTEGPQFQYNIDGMLVPFDINTNPSFVSMFNAGMVDKIDLLTGVLPSRYSYATGGVVDIQTKDGCDNPGGRLSVATGQRGLVQPTAQGGGCLGRFGYYASAGYTQGNTAFSSATPGPEPIHNRTNQGNAMGSFSYALDDNTKVALFLSFLQSDNQLPNAPGLTPGFILAGAATPPSTAINSSIDFRDMLGMLTVKGSPTADFTYQVGYAAHRIDQDFKPDPVGELIYQGVASRASHDDIDNTLQGDLTYRVGAHTLGAGFYVGAYRVIATDRSLVFPLDANGNQASFTPIQVTNRDRATNLLAGLYVDDLWQLGERWKLNMGLRWDRLTGFTDGEQIDPTLNLTFAASDDTTLHTGVSRAMQVPSFQGISPSAPAAFAGTSAAQSPGVSTPLTEDDRQAEFGFLHQFTKALSLSSTVYYEITHRYLDTGQFGVVPIFAPYNDHKGFIWGSETAITYREDDLSLYANATIGRNVQKGIQTGQFNFPLDELAARNAHSFVLDHQPLYGGAAGGSYRWGELLVSLDAIYSSGLRGGFANEQRLPHVIQVNASVEYAIDVPGVGQVVDRVSVLNLFDRVNLIRPANGIGIFQTAYGPRATVLNTVSVAF